MEWLSKYVFFNQGKQASGFMVALSNHLCRATEFQAFAPFLLILLYRGLFDESRRHVNFPSRPAGGPVWLFYRWEFLYLSNIVHHVPVSLVSHFPYGRELINHCREEEWLPLMVSGGIENILDRRCVCERKWVSPFMEKPAYLCRRERLPASYWSAVLTSRLLVLNEKTGVSFEMYNSQLCDANSKSNLQGTPFGLLPFSKE